jgi:hypothetical protein
MIELDIEHSQVPSVQPRHEAPSRLRPPQWSRVAGAKNTNKIQNTIQIRIIQNTRPPLVYFPSLDQLQLFRQRGPRRGVSCVPCGPPVARPRPATPRPRPATPRPSPPPLPMAAPSMVHHTLHTHSLAAAHIAHSALGTQLDGSPRIMQAHTHNDSTHHYTVDCVLSTSRATCHLAALSRPPAHPCLLPSQPRASLEGSARRVLFLSASSDVSVYSSVI